MITKELLKVEIEELPDEYLEVLFKIVKALKSPAETEITNQINTSKSGQYNAQLSWPDFIKVTYGCLADDPIKRGDQGKYEIREKIR
ncbi:MAG: hypothetical protein ACMUJM_01245 [bacterium]